jgi:hypothetical protein
MLQHQLALNLIPENSSSEYFTVGIAQSAVGKAQHVVDLAIHMLKSGGV